MRLDHDEFVCCPKQPPSVTPKTPDNPTSGVKIDPVTPNEAAAFDLSLKITASGLQNDAFLLANEDQLNQNLKQIVEDFPTVQPYFGKIFCAISYFKFNKKARSWTKLL